jgi:hypothetical protein
LNRNLRWILSAGLMLAALTAHAQDRGAVTTLPRPTGNYWLVSDTQQEQQPGPLLLPPQGTPASPPPVAPGPPPVLLDQPAPGTTIMEEDGAYPPFHHRVKADLLEAAILFPIVFQDLNNSVNVPGVGAFAARLPSVPLGIASPLIANIQFDLPRWGELNLRYRLLAAEGDGAVLGFDPSGTAAAIRSRLDMNVVDLTFARAGYGPLSNMLWFINDDPQKPLWGLTWDVGARFATVFYDTTALGATRGRHVSNFFIGGGPIVGMELHRLIGERGMKLFARADFGVNMGSSEQQFSQIDLTVAGAPLGFGYAAQDSFRAVPTLAVLAGIGGPSTVTRRGSWQVGYQFEEWFNFGNGNGSTADLVTHGVVLRWQYKY